jgi:mRNA-degrading endonuclease RelE of RelBE toxin-antitoxin system
MPDNTAKPVVQFTPEFKRNLRALAKKYRHIRDDVAPVIAELQTGALPGDQVPGIGYTIFKVRVPNRDRAKGKSGGYRIMYYLKSTTDIILVTIYSKTEQADISTTQIRRIVGEFQQES